MGTDVKKTGFIILNSNPSEKQILFDNGVEVIGGKRYGYRMNSNESFLIYLRYNVALLELIDHRKENPNYQLCQCEYDLVVEESHDHVKAKRLIVNSIV